MAILWPKRCRLPAALEPPRAERQVRVPERQGGDLFHPVLQAPAPGKRGAARVAAEESAWSQGSDPGANGVYHGSVHEDSAAGHALHGQLGQQCGLAPGCRVPGEAQLLLLEAAEGECPAGLQRTCESHPGVAAAAVPLPTQRLRRTVPRVLSPLPGSPPSHGGGVRDLPVLRSCRELHLRPVPGQGNMPGLLQSHGWQ